MDNRLKEIAKEILTLELSIQKGGPDATSKMLEMVSLTDTLTIDEMGQIDDYIQETLKKCGMV